MELEEFKSIVRQKPVSTWRQPALLNKDFIIERKSRTVLSKIKNSLLVETFFGMLFILAMGFVIARYPISNTRFFAIGMSLFCIVFLSYIISLYRKILRHERNGDNAVKENLQAITNILEQFSRLYFLITLIMVPLIFTASFLLVNTSDLQAGYVFFHSISQRQLIIFSGLSLSWYIAMYFFTGWYINKLYGHHLNTLKGQLKELEQQ